MRRARRDPLRWYPAAWRDRYGDELRALLEDRSGPGGPGLRDRVSLARHGLAEHARALRTSSDGAPEESRWRGGALLVLVAWAVFVVGGAGFSKASEHFAAVVPAGSRRLPQAAFDVVFLGGILGGVLVLAGALLAVPAFVRLLYEDGWSSLRRHFGRATVVTVVLVAVTIPLAAWAHSLSSHQRNGGSFGYGAAFLAWVVLAASCLASWTAVAVSVGRRLRLGRRVVRAEAGLALALALVMVVVTVATATWWGAMAVDAPSFLGGTASVSGAVLDPPLVLAMGAMALGLVLSTAGAVRIARR